MNKSHEYLETEPEPSRHRLTWPSPAGITPHGSNDSNVPGRGIKGSKGNFGMIQVVPEMVTSITMGYVFHFCLVSKPSVQHSPECGPPPLPWLQAKLWLQCWTNPCDISELATFQQGHQ